MRKYNDGRGWFNCSHRHSLSARGIKNAPLKIDYALQTHERALLMTDTEKEINQILYTPSGDAEDKELLTIEIPRDKIHHFDFLKAFTSFKTHGKWKEIDDVNFQLEIEFLDAPDEHYGERLMELFEQLNDEKVKEDVLYVRTEPVEESTLSYAKKTINYAKDDSGFDAGLVLQQLGGNKFIAMTGAKDFVKDDAKKMIVFKIGRNSKGVNYVRVKLNPMDTYDMEFLFSTVKKTTVKSKADGVYNDQLQDIFTEHTGMYTHL